MLAALWAAILGGCFDEAAGGCPEVRFVGPGDPACGSGRGGPMRRVPLPAGGTMCIDKTEVMVGAYQAFVASAELPELPADHPAHDRCAAKTTHAATCRTDDCRGTECELPQTCVDQCDALAYCRWVGKRLCGSIAGDALGLAEVNDPARSQWMNACLSGGRSWPYGPEYDGQACNTSDHRPRACGGPAVTAAYPECQAPPGPYDQVFDLSGNVSEWIDASVEAGGWPELRCVIVGGSYVHWWGDVSCQGATLEWPCDAHHPEFGFRCCAD